MPKAKQKPVNPAPSEPTQESTQPTNNQETTQQTLEPTQESTKSAPPTTISPATTNTENTEITDSHVVQAQSEVDCIHAQLVQLTDKEVMLRAALANLKEERKALEEDLLNQIRYLKSTYKPIAQKLFSF